MQSYALPKPQRSNSQTHNQPLEYSLHTADTIKIKPVKPFKPVNNYNDDTIKITKGDLSAFSGFSKVQNGSMNSNLAIDIDRIQSNSMRELLDTSEDHTGSNNQLKTERDLQNQSVKTVLNDSPRDMSSAALSVPLGSHTRQKSGRTANIDRNPFDGKKSVPERLDSSEKNDLEGKSANTPVFPAYPTTSNDILDTTVRA